MPFWSPGFFKLLILHSASSHQTLPALSDLRVTRQSTTRSLLCYSISDKHGWRKLFAWIMRLTSIPQIDELHSFYFSTLAGKKPPKLSSENSASSTAGMTNYKHSVWGRKKKKEIVCLSLWKCGCLLHFLPFHPVKQTKREGGRGNGSTSNKTASEIQSWKDVPADERQRDEAAWFLLHCTW